MNLPQELKDLPQWLVWRFIQKDPAKKPSKVPFYVNGDPRRGDQGGDADRAQLADFESAHERMALSGYDGIGFAFLPGDGLIGIDLDAALPAERQQAIVGACGTFAERSPSGAGVHIIGYGNTETFKSNDVGIEVFCGRQFFTMTGDNLRPEIGVIPPAIIEKLRRTVDQAKQARNQSTANTPAQAQLSDAAKVESALAMISPDCSYDAWIRIGMAIHAELGDGAVSVWDHWSARSSKYKGGKDIDSHWKSFRPGSITGASLFKMAMDAGWRPPRPAIVRPRPAATVDPETGEILEPANDNTPPPATDFGRPMDIFGIQPPPEMPMDVLPEALRDYVRDQADLTGCDPAIIGLGALVAAAACITDGIRLQPKRHDPTWTESARLWVAFVGDPSTKKSPAISKAVRHVKRIDHRMAEENASSFGDYKWQYDSWKEAKKADKNSPPPEPTKPQVKRIIVEDITVEALTEVLKDNPRGVLTLKDELTGWFASMDAYKGAGKGASMDRAHWLEAYNGGRRSIDRVTRGQITVPNWSTCIIGGVQPDMIRRVASSMGNDGLLQRFMILVARPAIMDADRTPDMDAMKRFGDLFDKLERLQPSEQAVRLSEAAHQSRERVAKYAKRLIDAIDHPHIQAWLGKWDGLFARLLLLYHVIECNQASTYPTGSDVSGACAAQVERLMCGTLLHHAIHFYSEILDANDRQEHSRQLGRLILAKGYTRITKRDITLQWKASRKMEWWELRQIIDALCVMDWLVPDTEAIDTDGKPRAWFVNEDVHKIFTDAAAREKIRRRDAVEAIKEMREAYACAL